MIAHAKRDAGAPIEAPPTLPAGALVRVTCSEDPWLRRYHGLYGRGVSDNGFVVEVSLKDGTVAPFWRREVDTIPGASGSRRAGPGSGDRRSAGVASAPGSPAPVVRH